MNSKSFPLSPCGVVPFSAPVAVVGDRPARLHDLVDTAVSRGSQIGIWIGVPSLHSRFTCPFSHRESTALDTERYSVEKY